MSDSIRAEDIQPFVLKGVPGPFDDRLGPVVRRKMLDSLAAQRLLWDQTRPRAYRIRVVEVSGCISIRLRPRANGKLLLSQLVVRDTSIVRRELAPIPAGYEQRCQREWRVDDLFADLARAFADTTTDTIPVAYDEVYGFPRAYTVLRAGSSHGGRRVIVESFAPEP
jgi:hypothetical protein